MKITRKIIRKSFQDVLQCQLEDLESTSHKLRKQLCAAEEQLHQKVAEVSALEAQLLCARRRTETLEEALEAATTKASAREVEMAAEAEGLRERAAALTEEAREGARRAREAEARAARAEEEAGQKARAMAHLQVGES